MKAKLKEFLLKLKLIDVLEEPNIRGETLTETIEQVEDFKREFRKRIFTPGYPGTIGPLEVHCFFCIKPLFNSRGYYCDRCQTAVDGKSLTKRLWRLRWKSFKSAIRISPKRLRVNRTLLIALIALTIAGLTLWRSW